MPEARLLHTTSTCIMAAQAINHDAHMAPDKDQDVQNPSGADDGTSVLPAVRATACEVVPRSFHATFACQWRRYVYLFPLRHEDAAVAGGGTLHDVAQRAHALLQPLCSCDVDFYAFGRMMPKGANCVCRLHEASVELVRVRSDSGEPVHAILVQLVGDRFVRRMVRVLVATLVRESVCGLAHGAGRKLHDIATARERLGAAPAAPAEGLCFAGAGYDGDSSELLLKFVGRV